MITIHPNPLPIWDEIPENTVQKAIYKTLSADLYSQDHIVEVKRATSSNPAYSTVGQVAYYRQALRLRGQDPIASILLYGSSLGKYTDHALTSLRLSLGVRLFLIVSLRDTAILDLDSGDLVSLE
jgi:hypothetical protein